MDISSNISQSQIEQLYSATCDVRNYSYAPYSNYPVGAALLAKTGEIIAGCNVENSSYPLASCAEKTAIVKAVSNGLKEFDAIYIITPDGGSPCGSCRQVLNEFNPNMLVITSKPDGTKRSFIHLNELLPQAFGPANLAN